jgi:hypothetical protein
MAHDDDDEDDEKESVKCGYEYCYCQVSEDDGYCSERCRKAARSERPSSYQCKCDHDDCEEDE